MGVDVSILIGHQLSLPEVMQMPGIVNGWTDVTAMAEGFQGWQPEKLARAGVDFRARWDWEDFVLTEERILRCWEYWENTDAGDDEMPDLYLVALETRFGWMKVNRHTVCITPYQHKWANLWHADTRDYLVAVSRLIAEHMGQHKVIYCVDSAFPQAQLEQFSFEGWQLEAIEAYGNANFGVPPKVWDKDAVNFYFVDRWGGK